MGKRKPDAVDMGRLRIRTDLAEKVQMLLEDPTKPGRIKYGAMKNYLERLIAQDLRERDAIAGDVLEEILNEQPD